MEDVVQVPCLDINSGRIKKVLTKSYLAFPPPLVVASKRAFNHLTRPRLKEGRFCELIFFFLKAGALDLVRRVSGSKSPFIWHALQSLQFLIYPPFQWILKLGPLKKLMEGIRIFSGSMIFLSAVTTFLDFHQRRKEIGNSGDDRASSPSLPANLETSERRIVGDASQSCMDTLHKRLLEDEVISLDRINAVDIRNFCDAANGDYSSLKMSLSKTIQWRESFGFFSSQELEMWSHLIFWHSRSVNMQHCLVVRLGLAFSSLAPQERACFIHAVVSQVEHGVQNLVDADNPKIAALLDCDGLSSMEFPMQMMRSCATVMQEHHPNLLAFLLVSRLPPSSIAIAETFIQNLKPSTQKKVQILDRADPDFLMEFLRPVPAFLGGDCTCGKCEEFLPSSQVWNEGSSPSKRIRGLSDGTTFHLPATVSTSSNRNCEKVLRIAMVGTFLLWILLVFLTGMPNLDDFLPS